MMKNLKIKHSCLKDERKYEYWDCDIQGHYYVKFGKKYQFEKKDKRKRKVNTYKCKYC